MKIYPNPPKSTWSVLLKRPAKDLSNLRTSVSEIMQTVRENGDAALRDFTARFDGVTLDELAVDAPTLAA
ncbi:MAG: histidinol dehydrogenase, partial [Bacteroidota bacterium]